MLVHLGIDTDVLIRFDYDSLDLDSILQFDSVIQFSLTNTTKKVIN